MTYALIAYLIANILDIVSTNLVLKRGGVELNPVMRWAMKEFGDEWYVFKLLIAIAPPTILLLSGVTWAEEGIWVCAAVYAIVAASNFRTARKLRDGD